MSGFLTLVSGFLTLWELLEHGLTQEPIDTLMSTFETATGVDPRCFGRRLLEKYILVHYFFRLMM